MNAPFYAWAAISVGLVGYCYAKWRWRAAVFVAVLCLAGGYGLGIIA